MGERGVKEKNPAIGVYEKKRNATRANQIEQKNENTWWFEKGKKVK